VLLDAEGIDLLDVTSPIAERAAELRARYGIRTPDAIQAATAVEAGATAFVTSDRRLRRIRELPVLVVGQYVRR
ncbi:MAG TPA: PIN domain-containing protein, partial [Candidatus Methylomirabilis sp.]